jgi:S-formylglutathione hydrolase FrmB
VKGSKDIGRNQREVSSCPTLYFSHGLDTHAFYQEWFLEFKIAGTSTAVSVRVPFSAASSWYLARYDAAVSRELATVGDLESLRPLSEGIDVLQ